MTNENYILRTAADGCIALSDDMRADERLETLFRFFWVKSGWVDITIDHIPQRVRENEIMCLTPLHHVTISDCNDGEYSILGFNHNFYCIFGHDDEVSCNGFLFYGASEPMVLQLDNEQSKHLTTIEQSLRQEVAIRDNLQEEMMRIGLKQFIISCTRIARSALGIDIEEMTRFDVARQFHVLVDQNFRTTKQVKEYASMLNRSPKTLTNLFSEMGLDSPLHIIHKRIASEAKRLLLYTQKSSKEIADILGFEDAASFSRFFKKMEGVSVTEYKGKEAKNEDKEKLPTHGE